MAKRRVKRKLKIGNIFLAFSIVCLFVLVGIFIVKNSSSIFKRIDNKTKEKSKVSIIRKKEEQKEKVSSVSVIAVGDNLIHSSIYKDANIYLDIKYNKYINYYKDYTLNRRGVNWSSENKAYVVTIQINDKRIRIGQSKDLEIAIQMRKEAEIRKMNIESQPA